MKKIVVLLFALASFLFAEEGVKHPWYMSFDGNQVFSNYQLEEQLDIPEEFGRLDTTKQDFLMRLSLENVKALYYSKGYFSLDLKMDIKREYLAQDSIQTGYLFTLSEGERYRFAGTILKMPQTDSVEIDTSSLNTSQDRVFEDNDIAEDLQYIQTTFRKAGYLHVYLDHLEKIDTLAKKIFVEITVQPGAKVIMGNITSSAKRIGDRRDKEHQQETGLTDTAWLSSLWKIPQGETIDGNQYNSFKNKLFSTQMFTQIKMSDSLREDGLSDVHLDVTERVPGEARYGFFYEEIYGFGAQAYAKHKNFIGHFHEFSTGFQVAQHKQEFSVGYANPLLFGTSFSFSHTL